MCCLVLLTLGCGRKELPFTDNSQDWELYVKTFRHMIETNCEAARKGDPSRHLAPLIQELDRDDRPVGPHKNVFLELRGLCREAVDLIQANEGSRPDLTAQLDGMIELAGELPEREAPTTKPPVEAGYSDAR